MSRKQRAIVLFLLLVVAVPGLVVAARKGRLIGRVVDPEGAPIEGVTVTATSAGVPTFNEVRTTDKKGTFIVDFEVVNVTYHYRFEKAGYQTFESDQGWSLEGTARHDFVMQPGTTAAVSELVPTSSSEPAITAYNAGAAAIAAKSYAAAQTQFQEAVQHDPQLRPAWTGLAVAQLGQEHYQEGMFG